MPDWRALRMVLGYTQEEMARSLLLSERSYWDLESRETHRCPDDRTVFFLRIHLQYPDVRKRLAEVSYPHPWPEDAPTPALYLPPLRPIEICPIDNVPLPLHARCLGCTELVGPGHPLVHLTEGLCDRCLAPKRRREAAPR